MFKDLIISALRTALGTPTVSGVPKRYAPAEPGPGVVRARQRLAEHREIWAETPDTSKVTRQRIRAAERRRRKTQQKSPAEKHRTARAARAEQARAAEKSPAEKHRAARAARAEQARAAEMERARLAFRARLQAGEGARD